MNWALAGVVASALVVCAAFAAEEGASPRLSRDIQRIANVLENEASSADPTVEPCAPGVDNRSSDLCAQWKAADAAQQSADAADRTVVIGWIGLVLGAITMGAAIAAAAYARRAAVATEQTVQHAQASVDGAAEALAAARRHADAAEAAVASAQRASELANRAYIGVGPVKTNWRYAMVEGQEEYVELYCHLRNFGNTPAVHVGVKSGVNVVRAGDSFDITAAPGHAEPIAPVFPGAEPFTPPVRVDAKMINECYLGNRVIYFFVECTYQDIYSDDRHKLTACLVASVRGTFEQIVKSERQDGILWMVHSEHNSTS